MVGLISALGIIGIANQVESEPVLWVRPDGKITVDGGLVSPVMSPGVKRVPAREGWGFDFDGKRAGMLLPDLRPFSLTGSLTVSVWLRPRSYVNDGPGAQILFRGDDRCGLDPYTLAIHGDGTINFSVQNEFVQGSHVTAELPLRTWTHVTGSFNADSGRLSLWLNGNLVAFSTTSRRPFASLDAQWAPGMGIGNVQNEKGPHNQPFNGSLYDLRLYRGALEPGDAGFLGRQPDPPVTVG